MLIVLILGVYTIAAMLVIIFIQGATKTVNYEITLPKRKCSVEQGYNCIKKLNSNCNDNPSYCQWRE